MTPWPETREVPLDPAQSAILFIDVQNFCARRDGGEWKDMSDEAFEEKAGWFMRRFEDEALPNMQRLQAGCREAGVEVMLSLIHI